MVQELRVIGQHVFEVVVYDEVTRGGKTAKNLPHPQFTLDVAGYENALGYYGSVATLVHNLNRQILTDSRNDYAEGITKGHNRDTLIKARGFSGTEEDGYLFKGFSKGLGARKVSDPEKYHLNKASDKKLSPVEQLEHLELAKARIKARFEAEQKAKKAATTDQTDTSDTEEVK